MQNPPAKTESTDTYYSVLQSLMQILEAYNIESRPKKLLDQVSEAIRVKHYARKTKQAHFYWIKKQIFFVINPVFLCSAK